MLCMQLQKKHFFIHLLTIYINLAERIHKGIYDTDTRSP
jgi:hypothetical protein